MTKRLHLTPAQAMERLYIGGPELASRLPNYLVTALKRKGHVEHCGVNGLLMVRLSSEGNYYMGASHEDLDNDAVYWRRKTGESVD